MGELLLSVPRPTGPRVVRVGNGEFQAVGLIEVSPIFPTRAAAEGWLKPQLTKVPASKRPQTRCCMRCRSDFQSEGFHHRMCNSCRNSAGGTDTGAYRVIRPSKRG
jgi:hypothetical protein